MEEDVGSITKQYSEDPRPLKAQISNLKADVKVLNTELQQTKLNYTECKTKLESSERKIDLLTTEIEK